MGRDYTLFVEARTAAGWAVPPAYDPGPPPPWPRRVLGDFAFPDRERHQLFWGPGALFPLRPGLPDDPPGPALREWLSSGDAAAVGWLPYEELYVDLWDTEPLTVVGRVPARHAPLFADGRQPYPAAAVAAAGLAGGPLDPARTVWLAAEPVDTTCGPARFELSRVGPEVFVSVSWAETVRTFLGDELTAAFRGLRRYGPDADLRILGCLS